MQIYLNLKRILFNNSIGLQINDMKKYSSYKSIKPINTSINYATKQPQSPTHSSSYRKLTAIDLSSQRPPQKTQIYPMSAKYSNYVNITATNAVRKKMFSSKNIETPIRPLTLTKQTYEQPTPTTGYGNIRSKINDLQSRLYEIKKNYDQSYNNRKLSQKDKSMKLMKQNQKSSNLKLTPSSKNKENEIPKQKKTQSKLLLQRYQENKKLKNCSSASTINIMNAPQNSLIRQQTEYNKPPLSPKIILNINNAGTCKKTQPLPLSSNYSSYNNNSSNIKTALKNQQNKMKPLGSPQSTTQQSSYLKQYVTTFTCDNKLPIQHSNSQTNLYKPHNKLSLNNNSQLKSQYYVTAVLNAFQSKSLTSFENLCRNHLTTSLDILTYIKNSRKQPPFKYNCRQLPPVKDNKHTIIFDLDETLIHCNQNLTLEHDVALPIKFPNGAVLKAGINVRPYARQCLKQLSKYFELIVFTASHQCYGNVIVDYLDPNKQFISHRYFRDSCFKTQQGFYVKDLRVVDRDLRKVLLIDNAAYSYSFQLQNGVPIIPFYDNKADLQLKNLIPYLKAFLTLNDVRVKNQQSMKLTKYTNFKEVRTLINKLYAENQ